MLFALTNPFSVMTSNSSFSFLNLSKNTGFNLAAVINNLYGVEGCLFG